MACLHLPTIFDNQTMVWMCRCGAVQVPDSELKLKGTEHVPLRLSDYTISVDAETLQQELASLTEAERRAIEIRVDAAAKALMDGLLFGTGRE